jgi:DNA-directed RNA polymerase subunit beta'
MKLTVAMVTAEAPAAYLGVRAHIGGTASRVSQQSTLDAKHAGTVHYQGLQVVEAKGTGENAGQMVVMNRTGSLVVTPRARSRAVSDRLRRAPRGDR